MSTYVFAMTVKDDKVEELRAVNRRYAEAWARVAPEVEGLRSIEKYLNGTLYVERIEYEGDFGEFGKALGADEEIRQFMREANDCFEGGLRSMGEGAMEVVEALEPARA